MSGDQASCVKWKTSRLNSSGKPIYLRKYLHAGFIDPATADNLESTYHSALVGYGDLAVGVNSHHGGLRSRTHDETLIDGAPMSFVTTRTLKRRGRRPKRAS